MTSKEKLDLIVAAAEDLKAENIEILDVHDKTSLSDYFVVCSGTSDRHADSIAEKVVEQLRLVKERPFRETGQGTGWILQDYGDVILHVMRDEQRQFYDLETLWKNAQVDPNLPK